MTATAGKVGFIGLGNMGSRMAANLVAAGYRLLVSDADVERQATFAVEHGCVAVGDPQEFAEVEVVVTMLPDDRAVASVLLDDGVAAVLPSGAVVVDMSSSNPAGTRALRRSLPDSIGLVDAPVSGGVQRAASGELSIVCGSDDPAAIERVRPILEVMGTKVFYAGALGCGHALKVLNNYMVAAAYLAASEAVLIGARFGLDPGTMLDMVNTSTGRSFASEAVVGGNVITGKYATGFALGLLAKDVRIASELAEGLGVEVPALRLVNERWTEAANAIGAAADHSRAHQAWWPADDDLFQRAIEER